MTPLKRYRITEERPVKHMTQFLFSFGLDSNVIRHVGSATPQCNNLFPRGLRPSHPPHLIIPVPDHFLISLSPLCFVALKACIFSAAAPTRVDISLRR